MGNFEARGIPLDLSSADLSGANLQGADLSGADLRWAELTGVRVDQRTNLTRANLSGQDVAKLDPARMDQCVNRKINVLVRDGVGDNGSVPSRTAVLCDSPDLVVSESRWSEEAKQAFLDPDQRSSTFDSPVSSKSSSWLYVRVSNIGIEATKVSATLYARDFSTGLWHAPSSGWNKIGEVRYKDKYGDKLNAGGWGLLGPLEWTIPPGQDHYCLMCVLSFEGNPAPDLAFDNQAQFQEYIRNHGNMAWQNTARASDSGLPAFRMLGMSDQPTADHELRMSVDWAAAPGRILLDGSPVSAGASGEVEVLEPTPIPKGAQKTIDLRLAQRQPSIVLELDPASAARKIELQGAVKTVRFIAAPPRSARSITVSRRSIETQAAAEDPVSDAMVP